jgi:hypothetical protein
MELKFFPFLFSPSLLVLFFAMSAMSQSAPKTYDAQWKIATDFISKGLPASALKQIKEIYQLAKKEKQEAQVIKAITYMAQVQEENQENNDLLSIQEIEKELITSQEPSRSILNSLLAGQYWYYYQNIRWKLYQRTPTADFQQEDLATWGTEDFHKKISALYLLSLKEEKLLKQSKPEQFDAILTKGNTRKLRPTLFDILAFKALEYFSSNERDIKKSAKSFELNTASAFDPAADFIHRKFQTQDSTSLEYKALLIYQNLISFHANDKQPDALIDADIQRLQFVKQKSRHPDADQLYFYAMNHLADQYATTPAAAQAWYLTALWHQQKGEGFDARKDTSARFEKVRALEICEKIIKENPESEGGVNASNLRNAIRQKSLLFTLETVNVPDLPFRTLVEYSNFSTVYLKLIKASESLKKEVQTAYGGKIKTSLLAAPALRIWQQNLPDTKDFQKHQVEIKIDALPIGEYFLVASTNEDFSGTSATTGARLFTVSNISYVSQNEHFFVVDRTTGQPLQKANVQFWDQTYDYKEHKNIRKKGAAYLTDKNGYFKRDTTNSKNPTSFQLEISYEKDKLFPEDTQYHTYSGNEMEEPEDVKYFLFTDRSIYRPGQSVFYKAIALKGNRVLEDKKQKIEVFLNNANGEIIGEATHFVNDYGTFSGVFQLPQNTLNGTFNIDVESEANVVFNVEEYKRPKFEVTYAPVQKPYQVNDTITVNGIATAYAGNAIDGANVKYRVVRMARFIYPWLSKGWYRPSSAPMEIAHGETTTDKNGKFTLDFTAIPDLTISRKTEPVFDYLVYADVTDLNGETRSGEKSISAGYNSILLKLDLPETLSADSLKNLSILTENINGTFEPSHVQVKISKLKAEQRLIRNRLWERPDQFVLNKTEYVSLFPHDEYDNETDPETWETEAIVIETADSLKKDKKFSLPAEKLVPGYYHIEITTKDKNGQEVKLAKHFEVTDPRSKQLNVTKYLWSEGGNAIEPGQKTELKLGTSAANLFVIQSVLKQQKTRQSENFSFLNLNKEKLTFTFSATESDRGGYQVSYLFVKDGRFYQYNDIIQIPWTNKELKITYATFRDKTLPGSEEKWTVKISGYKQDQVAAEMLASMYDASLDQFYPHAWTKPNIWPIYNQLTTWKGTASFGFKNSNTLFAQQFTYRSFDKRYDALIEPQTSRILLRGAAGGGRSMRTAKTGVVLESAAPMIAQDATAMAEVVMVGYGNEVKKDQDLPEGVAGKTVSPPQIRTNFNETAFFFPDLKTDQDGSITFSFRLPEALTKWKFQALAHTKELAIGYSTKEIVTQKDLMVQPNPPRFLREGDKFSFSSKIVNLTDKALNGTVTLQLFDTETNKPVDALFKNTTKSLAFSVLENQSTAVQFPIEIPENFSKTLTWRLVATAGSVSDGEENILPILPNRMLVTESMPLNMNAPGSKTFRFEKLLNSANSKSIKNQALTVEYTSNPAWYAIQSLPYLMEYPHECAEQTWNRYYANALAGSIVNSSPRIAKVFEKWKTEDTTALLSNLQKNAELKSVLLEETPWVIAGKSESEQKRNIGLLFDMVRMSRESGVNLGKLKEMQSPNGGFVWFKGGPDDRYMTQYIVSGIGHLRKLKAVQKEQEALLKAILDQAIPYLDARLKTDYEQLVKSKTDLKNYIPGALEIQYLYARSFFTGYKIPDGSQRAYSFYSDRAAKTWVSQNKYLQGMIALETFRSKDVKTAQAILKSLRETATKNEELGMSWKTAHSWWWQENAIERQALLIEAFQEVGSDTKTVDQLRTWLLKNKQTNRWESTKATAEACYALLLQGTDWLTSEPAVTIKLGDKTILSTADDQHEAGTGYFKKSIDAQNVNASSGLINVHVETADKGKTATTWGAVYWQYFEDLDKITFAETPIKIEKKLFVEKNTDKGPVLSAVTANATLSVGDKIKVRIVLRVDRDMEYVHMKDMRASALEPSNVLSSYKWQGGLGYYESTKDASTNFFFNYLRKGTYVFEYPLFVTHSGNFSNGITTIQSMYAPEFTAHSEGLRIKIEK